MGLIRFEIKTGTAPFTAELLGSGLAALTNLTLGEHQFTPSVKGNYTLKITDSDGCVSNYPIEYCTCDAGFTEVVGGCVQYNTTAAYLTEPIKPLAKRSYSNYSQYGSLIFEPGFNINGTGTYEKIDDVATNNYWKNAGLNTVDGPMNRSCVWSSQVLIPQDIGFSFCIDILVEKTYYVGVGCDNWSKLKINGTVVLDQGINGGSLDNALAPLMSMLSQDSRVAFRNWFIYPMVLKAGRNVIEVFGHNHTASLAGFGMEIYDASPNDLKSVSSDVELGDKLLFRAKDLVPVPPEYKYLDYSYNPTEGVRGYSCPDDGKEYSLVTCDGEPYCMETIFIPCE